MTYQDFINKVAELAGGDISKYGNSELQHVGKPVKLNYYSDWEPVHGKLSKYSETKYILRVEWSTGGMSGGNCWNDCAPTYRASDEQPAEFQLLDTILEHFKPNISFIQYKLLTQTLVEHGSRTSDEYYGNSSEYATKTIELEKLFNYMNEKQWLNA